MRHNGTRYDAGRRSRDNPSGGPGDKLATSQFQLARRKSLGIRWASGSIPIARARTSMTRGPLRRGTLELMDGKASLEEIAELRSQILVGSSA